MRAFPPIAGALLWLGWPSFTPGAWQPAPYRADPHTLHLWHLDEAAPPFQDEATPGMALHGLLNGAQPGQAAMPDFGAAVSFHHHVGGVPSEDGLQGAILLGARFLDFGTGDNVPPSFAVAGADGAFTFEALVKLDVPPADAPGVALGILTMDGEDADKERVFQFRIEKDGFLAFLPLRFRDVTRGALATIPTDGPHAATTSDWFHVAATYNGREGTDENLLLYWTNLGRRPSSAHRIGQGSLAADLPLARGDFAIGNEARASHNNAEASPFPGRIDEVRISRVARHPTDFCFVDPAARVRPGANADEGVPAPLAIRLTDLRIDDAPAPLPAPGGRIDIASGLHRLDLELETLPVGTVRVRYQLAGLDDTWQESAHGMVLMADFLDAQGGVLSRSGFPFIGASPDWAGRFLDSRLRRRREPILIPGGARAVRMTLSSGAPDTTGLLLLDDLDLRIPRGPGNSVSLWFNSSFNDVENPGTPGGRPRGWERGGSEPAIARLSTERYDPALTIVDASLSQNGVWLAEVGLPQDINDDAVAVLTWNESFHVIGGQRHRVTFVNVPPGEYTFRAIAASSRSEPGRGLALSLVIRPPVWARPWFGALVGSAMVAGIAGVSVWIIRQRSRRRIARLRLRHALAEERERIARDMHDDLGTRLTLLTLNAAAVQRQVGNDPAKAGMHLKQMETTARELVVAMDDLVWAVDPANDTLDQLAVQIIRTAQEIFRDSDVRCVLDIPPALPDINLPPRLRHHLALVVKESCHNILRHAGPCQAHVSLALADRTLTIRIRDSGRGFVPEAPSDGNGLTNMRHRLREVAGTLDIQSQPGRGTDLLLSCPIPAVT